MSEAPATGIPEWDIADRLRKTLRDRHIGVQEMADHLDVSRNTVSTWINGRIEPSRQTLMLWALRTGVPLKWLETGEAPHHDPDGVTMEGLEGAGRPTLAYIVPRTSHLHLAVA